ncbi:MAG TPA: hypothetical protein VMM38_05570 [Aridibacter sp.]|nr:hypothetical protein [Aridibacter sp.]
MELLTWIFTFLVQVPIHNSLSKGFDDSLVKKLVRTNLLRTVAWSLRSGICLYVLWALLAPRL